MSVRGRGGRGSRPRGKARQPPTEAEYEPASEDDSSSCHDQAETSANKQVPETAAHAQLVQLMNTVINKINKIENNMLELMTAVKEVKNSLPRVLGQRTTENVTVNEWFRNAPH